MDENEGMARIREIVADCLALEPEEVRPDGRLFADLGADSLDYVEMIFALEKAFDVKVGQDDLSFLTRLDLTDPEVMRDGVLTEAVVTRAAEWLPALSEVPDESRLTPQDLWSLVTVETLWRVVRAKLSGQG